MKRKSKQIRIRSKGEDRRSFCYVSDAARAIFMVWSNGKAGEAYNIGSDEENISIFELANKIAKILDNEVIVNSNLDAPITLIYGVPTRNLDISKLRSLGFSLKISLDSGLQRLKEYVEEVGWRWDRRK